MFPFPYFCPAITLAVQGAFAYAQSGADVNSYTFYSVPIGDAAVGRVISVFTNLNENNSAPSTTAVTVNGTALTYVGESDDGTHQTRHWTGVVESGTTATIVVTAPDANGMNIAVHPLYNVNPTPTAIASSLTASTTINVPAGGAVVACALHSDGVGRTWTGLDEDMDVDNASHYSTAASRVFPSAQTGHTISVDTTTNDTLLVVAYAPL